jgi:hypothetical protein
MFKSRILSDALVEAMSDISGQCVSTLSDIKNAAAKLVIKRNHLLQIALNRVSSTRS